MLQTPMPVPWKRVLAFVVLFAVLYELLSLSWGSGLAHWVIDVATVRPAAWMAGLLSGDPSIVAVGPRLQSASTRLNVLFGCEGTDVFLVLAAALLVTPVSWRARGAGLLGGVAFVFVVNQLRLLALFFSLRYRESWFGPIHGLLAPIAIVALVTLFYLAWLRWTQSQRQLDVSAA